MSATESAAAEARPRTWLGALQCVVSAATTALAVTVVTLPITGGIPAFGVGNLVFGFLLLTGIPTALLIYATGRASAPAAIGGGAIVGGLIGIPAFPVGPIVLGAVGAVVGAFAWLLFWLQQEVVAGVARRWQVAAGLAMCLAIAASGVGVAAGLLALMKRPTDITCHNVFRRGGRSFPVVLSATMPLDQRDWPALEAALEGAAREGRWSVREHSRERSFGVSVCQEEGTQITLRQWVWMDPPEAQLTVNVVAPQGGEGWKAPTRRLLQRLEGETGRRFTPVGKDVESTVSLN